ncbi:MAG: hypothetical protein ABR548_13185 [Actinomycetota bacterium]|nr:hypothetical protein [Actinomycetota bacterium]
MRTFDGKTLLAISSSKVTLIRKAGEWLLDPVLGRDRKASRAVIQSNCCDDDVFRSRYTVLGSDGKAWHVS